MTEKAAKEPTATVETDARPKSTGMGMVHGVPGRNIVGVGALDLRGVAPEDLAQIESMTGVGAVLLDAGQRTALAGAKIEGVGAMIEIDPDYRILMEPWIEFSRATLEAMPGGQKLAIIGIILFQPDVPAALVAEKIDKWIIVGVVLSTAAVHGALLGKVDHTGVHVTLPEKGGPLVHSVGEITITPGYLSHLQDGSTYVNIGCAIFGEEVPVDLLAQKFATYLNVGLTQAPQPILDLLQARCPTNAGKFALPGAEEEEEEK